jgi:hypothetical protein
VYYNSTIEERFNKQDERNNLLAKSLAGISAELKTLSSQHPQHPIQPAGSQEQTWSHSQMPRPVYLPANQNTTPFIPPAAPQSQLPFYHPYQ